MEHVRRPAVAGAFYLDRAEQIDGELRRLIKVAEARARARAVVVPHAAWRYSGRVAGEVFGHLSLPLVRYETSGDASGDYDRIVGYAGVIVHECPPEPPAA